MLALITGLILVRPNPPETNVVLQPALGHAATCTSAGFSSDGGQVITSSFDGSARVWDTKSGLELFQLRAAAGSATHAAFSPTRPEAAVSYLEGTVRIWDLTTRKVVRVLRGHTGAVNSVEYSPGGDRLITASADATAQFWDASTGANQGKLVGHTGPIWTARYSRNGQRAVTASLDGNVAVWQVADKKLLYAYRSVGKAQNAWCADISPDGSTIAAAFDDGNIELIPLSKPDASYTLKLDTWVADLTFAPNGKELVAGCGDGKVRIFDQKLQIVGVRQNHSAAIRSVRVAYGRLVTASADHTAVVSAYSATGQGTTLSGTATWPASTALIDGGKTLILGSKSGWLTRWDLNAGRPVGPRDHLGPIRQIRAGMSGSAFAVLAQGGVRFYKSPEDDAPKTLVESGIDAIDISGDGKSLAACTDYGQLQVLDTKTGRAIANTAITRLDGKGPVVVQFSARTDSVLVGREGGTAVFSVKIPAPASSNGEDLTRITVKNFASVHTLGQRNDFIFGAGGQAGYQSGALPAPAIVQGAPPGLINPRFLSNSDLLLSGSEDGRALIFSMAGDTKRAFVGHLDRVTDAQETTDGRFLVTSSDDHTVRVWDRQTGAERCTIIVFENGQWAVVAPDGRFDAENLEDLQGLHWVYGSWPPTPLPIEIFTREYFEPGLLSKIWRNEPLRPVQTLADLNRSQPKLDLSATLQGDKAIVTVRATQGDSTPEPGGSKSVQHGIPQDLRVFVNGKLATYEDGQLPLDSSGTWSKSLPLDVPHNGEQSVEISAYCFNQSKVKSNTARQTLPLNVPRRQGHAYIICIGVDDYNRSDLALQYSAADARLISESLSKRLTGFVNVVTVSLLSDASHADATKKKFRTVLAALAGLKPELDGIPNGNLLAKSTLEDLVIISWSGHGLSTRQGQFYLLPRDVENNPETYGKPFLDSCVSSDELSLWLRDVAAGDMALIIDACHSAAATRSDDFRPGPLGNRGLGQLAYEKGIRVLAATQSANVALESGKFGHGLLTYALIEEGLNANKAGKDNNPPTLKEWLSFTVDRVPQLYRDLQAGTLKLFNGPRTIATSDPTLADSGFLQRPDLFDYTRSPTNLPFVGR